MNIEYHIWGVLAHGMLRGETTYTLPPIKEWTKEFCEALNHITYSKKIKFELPSLEGLCELKKTEENEIWQIFGSYGEIEPVENCYIVNLPDDVNYVRFTDTVILREEDKEIAKACSESIRKGLGIYRTFQVQLEELLKKNTEPAKDDCELLEQICALQAHFTADNQVSGQEKRPASDHNAWHELLQNVNDHIDSEGCLGIKLTDDTLTLSYKEGGHGFTTRDFVAVCTSGNSGNIGFQNEEAKNNQAEGHKGTGFKSVYNFFSKVEIKSGKVTCTLDDTTFYDYSSCCCFIENEKMDLSKKKKKDNITRKSYFPVPQFEFDEKEDYDCTTITLTFTDTTKRDEFLKDVLTENSFQITPTYYFLNNIKKISFNNTEHDLEKHISDNFYVHEESFEVDNDLLGDHPRWKDKTDDFKNAKKNIIRILFPKEIGTLTNTSLYCTLPITDEVYNVPFYINCPALELKDDRKSLSDNCEDWNNLILEKALKGEDSCFKKIFEDFAKDNPDTAYRYFPYKYLEEWGCLNDIPFIRTVQDGNGSKQLMSISQWHTTSAAKKGFVFLPQYLYDWFKAKNGLNDFSCDVPFVYYDKDTDYEDIRKKLGETKVTQEVLSSLFPPEGNSIGNIWNYFLKQYYVKRDSCLSDEADIKLLQALHDDAIYFTNISNKKCYCYRCYLGETICESKVHALGESEISVHALGESETLKYQSIMWYQEQLQEKFAVDEAQLKEVFPYLREELYRIKDEQGNYIIVDHNDEFLNTFICNADNIMEAFKQAKALGDKVQHPSEQIQIKSLIYNGKVAVKCGDDSYYYSNTNLYTSSKTIREKFIVCEPEWVKSYLPNLDEEVKKAEFFSKTPWEILEKIISAYRNDLDVANAIIGHLKTSTNKSTKEENLFRELLQWNIIINWKDWCKKYIKQYMEHAKEKILGEYPEILKFKFEENSLHGLPIQFIEKFNDRVEETKKETLYKVLGMPENPLKELIKDIRYYENEGGTFGYCIGYEGSSSSPYLITLGEKGVEKLLKDIFDCDQYLIPKQYTGMDCFSVMPLFKSYDTWNDEQIEDTVKSFEIPENEELKLRLVDRFEMKMSDRWYCFAGYGAGEFTQKCCPVCGGILIAETSMLRIRTVKAVQGKYVPVLICSNCHQAFSYVQDIFLCKQNGDPYESQDELEKTLKSTDPLYIKFIMSTFECKIFELPMTFLHRVICLKKLRRE